MLTMLVPAPELTRVLNFRAAAPSEPNNSEEKGHVEELEAGRLLTMDIAASDVPVFLPCSEG